MSQSYMPEWVAVINESEFPPNGRKAFVIQGIPVAIFKLNNSYYAIHNQCTHENFPLDDGELEADLIICPRHGAKFCIKTGEVKSAPAFEDLTTYPLRIENGVIQIQITF